MDAGYDGSAGAAFTHYPCRGRMGFITEYPRPRDDDNRDQYQPKLICFINDFTVLFLFRKEARPPAETGPWR
jgi:hypothetical protein